MSHDTIARWQFAITTVYHFLFVPLTIGLSLLVAGMQTAWNRTGSVEWLRLTRFWGKLMLINFAMGVVTGIVQEFQFGMNWSDYSRFVGDVFGAPLAMEALIAFFLESTFLGLWIFGWDRLPKRVHLATIWLASLGTVISAYFILAANSWMQHPVGYRINPRTGHAQLTSIWKVLTNPTQMVTFPHVLMASLLTGGAVVVGLSCWHLRRGHQVELHRRAVHLGLVVCAVASVGVMLSGHFQGQVMTRQQPMKMASAEALWDTEDGAGLSLFAYGDVSHGDNKIDIKIPHLMAFMATNSFSGKVQGVNDLQAAEVARYGPGDYTPVMGVTFWNFRIMMGLGAVYFGLSLLGLARMRGGHLPGGRFLLLAFMWAAALPYAANTAGWIFTEMGRQPWVVFGLLRTSSAVSPGVSTAAVIATLAGFTVIYGALATVALRLFLRHGRHEIPALSPNVTISGEPRVGVALPSLAY
ncbi:cytochrome ubiquinol oxidase subunit I [Frankia sp. Cppng1_Ct_nod]|uniref:cytochrome ubiquinol oxidase subunit I n=1 Tax=Frankia sp. Cppng1_Ct_nod TaxID=2897162 RepID=UPI00104104EF|nr:cytochrome ubiquinol oxidase subunit I [Frankia sp. Cppng1_Ct_nod]